MAKFFLHVPNTESGQGSPCCQSITDHGEVQDDLRYNSRPDEVYGSKQPWAILHISDELSNPQFGAQ